MSAFCSNPETNLRTALFVLLIFLAGYGVWSILNNQMDATKKYNEWCDDKYGVNNYDWKTAEGCRWYIPFDCDRIMCFKKEVLKK